MDDSDTKEIQKKALLFESQYNTLKNEFKDYIETSRRNEALKKKELQSDFVKKMLVFADSLSRISSGVNTGSCDIVRQASENFQKNIDSMYSQLLSASGLTPVDPTPGEKFNDELHMAVGLEYGCRYPEGSVFTVIRKGYKHENILIRPAEVIISKFPVEEIKTKSEGIRARITDRIFPSRHRFTLFISQTLAEKQDIERHMREQAETIERLKEEIDELKETVLQSLEVKQDIECNLHVQAETIDRLEIEMEDLKETVSQNFIEDTDIEILVPNNPLTLQEQEDYTTDEYKFIEDTDLSETMDLQNNIKKDN